MAAKFGAREVARLETVYASPAIATQLFSLTRYLFVATRPKS